MDKSDEYHDGQKLNVVILFAMKDQSAECPLVCQLVDEDGNCTVNERHELNRRE